MMTGLHLVGKINNRHIIYILLVFVKVKSGNSYLVIDLLFLGCSPRTCLLYTSDAADDPRTV